MPLIADKAIRRTAKGLGALAGFLVLASLVPSPFGGVRRTPHGGALLVGTPVPPATVTLLRRACTNCHSNETAWPWYSQVAPASWLVERDVTEARKHMNFSQWPAYGADGQRQLLAAAEAHVNNGMMPPARYLLLHPEALLSQAEKDQLGGWFRQKSKEKTK